MNCPYKDRCWRLSYTRQYQHDRYTTPPDRLTVVLNGFATANMCNHSKADQVYCERMPGNQGNFCPDKMGRGFQGCEEYKKETARLNQLRIAREKRQRKQSRATIREKIPVEIRQMIAKKARYKCQYCGVAQNQIVDGKKTCCAIDHRIPLNKGGTNDPRNLVFACRKCNREKSDQIWEIGCKLIR